MRQFHDNCKIAKCQTVATLAPVYMLMLISTIGENFTLSSVNEEHVLNLIMGLNSHKATGLDGLPARFVIDSADIICKPLTHIINLSIQSRVFPCDMKKAKITRIYKKKAKTDAGNYRPVSILNIISKIIEKIACELIQYLKCTCK